MVLAHSLVMNGGVLHAVESLTADELAAAIDGYEYFGLRRPAAVLREISARAGNRSFDLGAVEKLESEADERYAAVVSGDAALVTAFEARYVDEPSAFDPVR